MSNYGECGAFSAAVSETRQEVKWRCCGEGRLAWMPNEEQWPGPPRQG